MKKILVLTALLFSLAFSLASAEMVDGFNTYAWGTSQSSMNESLQLIPIDTNKKTDVKYYFSTKDVIQNEKGDYLFIYNYGFVDEKLTSGVIVFFNKSEYDRTVKEILNSLTPESHLPKLKGDYKNVSHYLFKDTRIMIQDWNHEENFAEIIFVNEKATP